MLIHTGCILFQAKCPKRSDLRMPVSNRALLKGHDKALHASERL